MISQVLTVSSLLAVAAAHPAELDRRLNNGVGVTPALGWNSWNQGGCNAASATVAMNTAKAFISLGLKDLGYTYVNIDDCWSQKSRNSSGYLVPDSGKFPKGIKGLADDIHGLGLKLGLYGDAGTQTCGGYPGSKGNEQKDANTLASWGVDYWKYDNCWTNGGFNNAGSLSTQSYYPIMTNALKSSGRTILFSMCQWGRENVWTWGANVGNSWRMSDDIQNNWNSVAGIAAKGATIAQYAAPGAFNDLDMMQLGNGVLTEAEERTHFALWALMKSPILLGTDVTKLKQSTLTTIKNKGVIAVSQDKLGKSATTFTPKGQAGPQSGKLYKYWAGPLSDGTVVALVAADGAATLSVNFADVPGLGSGNFSWTELYSGKTGSGTSVSQQLGSHDIAIYKVVRQS